MSCNIPNNCPDCGDLHSRNLAHNCHCHEPLPELPNLSGLMGAEITGVFYLRDKQNGKVKGLNIMTQNNMTLSIKLDGDKLDIGYAGSV